jgi:hypothetical protein
MSGSSTPSASDVVTMFSTPSGSPTSVRIAVGACIDSGV